MKQRTPLELINLSEKLWETRRRKLAMRVLDMAHEKIKEIKK